MVFRLLDRDGRPIGEVVQPSSAPEIGRGARTVLLVRDEGGDRVRPPADRLFPAQHSLLRV
jgi:hypothetical protein